MVLTFCFIGIGEAILAVVAFASLHSPWKAPGGRIVVTKMHLPLDMAPDLTRVEASSGATAVVFSSLVNEAAVVVLGVGGLSGGSYLL